MTNDKRLLNRVAIVTGASSGVGRSISLAYSYQGAKVVCADLRPEPRAEAAGEVEEGPTHEVITKKGGEAIFVRCDVTKSADIQSLIKEVVAKFGRLDIMVNNAGVACPLVPVNDTSDDDFDHVMSINCRGVFLGCKYASQQMLTQEKLNENGDRGWIVNVASTFALIGMGNILPYVTSKHAVAGITKVAALDLAPHGIHVNAICPSWTETALVSAPLQSEPLKQLLTSMHPWGRLGKLTDLSGAAVLLASDDAAFMTGAFLVIDGGSIVQ
ncbi:putative oxidoreductase [Hyphodiscus hymeniophilus]|uniref:Oxidoreductase n=1 Tax=Hyphodiscus hymeniophilus TaxID=353542 RepID=A0A9P7AV80_9HELO|nr:putative oxidoreductase [Hyphodiscus hymeniophilus]